MAETAWDSAITMQLAANGINSTECSNRIVVLGGYCDSLDGGNSTVEALCEVYDQQITLLTAQVATYATLVTALNNRMYSNLAASEQTAVDAFYTVLDDDIFFRNIAINTNAAMSTMATRYNDALQSTPDANAVADAVKKDILTRIYYELNNSS